MKCPHCGSELPGSAKFCASCGSPVSPQATDAPTNVEAQPTQQVPFVDSNNSAAYSTVSGPSSSAAANSEPSKAPKKNTFVKVAIVLIIVAILGVGGYFAYQLISEKFFTEASEVPATTEAPESEEPATTSAATEVATESAETEAETEENISMATNDSIINSNPITIDSFTESVDSYGRTHLIFYVTNESNTALSEVGINIYYDRATKDKYGDYDVESKSDQLQLTSVCDAGVGSGGSEYTSLSGYFKPGKVQCIDLMVAEGEFSVEAFSNFDVRVSQSFIAKPADAYTDHIFNEDDFAVVLDVKHSKATITNNTGHYLNSCKFAYIAVDAKGEPYYDGTNVNGGSYYEIGFSADTLKPGESTEVGFNNRGLEDWTNWKLIRIRYDIDGNKEEKVASTSSSSADATTSNSSSKSTNSK